MHINHLDVGVRRALRAYKLEKGLSEAAADAFANAKLAEGLAYVKTITDRLKNSGDGEALIAKAFADLKVWAQTQT
jgi:hypothetical protein